LDDLVDMLFSAAEDLRPDEETVPIGPAGDDNGHEKKFHAGSLSIKPRGEDRGPRPAVFSSNTPAQRLPLPTAAAA